MTQEFTLIDAKVTQGGIRVDLEGQWWFYNSRTKSFTRHRPGAFTSVGWSQTKVQGPERVDKYANRAKLIERLGHCQPLIEALDAGILRALLADELSKVA